MTHQRDYKPKITDDAFKGSQVEYKSKKDKKSSMKGYL